jgi:toxin ParE1/3/4
VKVVYAPRSLRDLQKIHDYLLLKSASKETADNFISDLLNACDGLEHLPERYPCYPYAPDWRMLPFGNYLVFFRAYETEIRIAHVRHAARKPFKS